MSEPDEKRRHVQQQLYRWLKDDPFWSHRLKHASRGVFVYRDLKSILGGSGTKADLLQHQPQPQALVGLVDLRNNPWVVAQEWQHRSRPLVMVTTQHSHYDPQRLGEQEKQLLTHTTALVSLRSLRYRKIITAFTHDPQQRFITRQCMPVYLPDLWLMDEPPLGPVHACLVSGVSTLACVIPEEHERVIRAKLTCLFDMALKRQHDVLILTDLYVETSTQADFYVRALKELMATYMFQFHAVVVVTRPNTLLHDSLERLCFQSGLV